MKNKNNGDAPLEEPHEDWIQLYESWVATLNHYSGLVLTIRITAITSGIIILAAAGTILLKEAKLFECRLVCIFGVLFSAVLWLMVRNYYKHYDEWLDFVVDAESEMNLPNEMHTWTLYKDKREKRDDRCVWIVHNGCTTLIILASIAIFLLTFFS